MTENEQLARWLGVADTWRGSPSGSFPMSYPNFRTSNEWAGALLSKLGEHSVELDGNGRSWACRLGIGTKSLSQDWRDAVVDAALEVIRRTDNGTGE